MQVMSQTELAWVDAYHQEVLEKVSARLQHLPEELKWLQAHCAPLEHGANGAHAPKVSHSYIDFVVAAADPKREGLTHASRLPVCTNCKSLSICIAGC